jgi:putative DNA-invertase from lambdoid prophage Rac
MNNPIKKVAIYCRVSTNQQDTLNQEIRLTEFASEKKWEFDIFREVESTRKSRPVKQELLAKIRRCEYDAIVIYKLDRYARSSTELILEVKEILEKGVAFISVCDNLDFSSATGKLHFQILSAFAEFERELIRERTIEGLARVRKQGKSLGRPKGSKDRKKRVTSGYVLREAFKRKKVDEKNGVFKHIHAYINT